MRVRRGCGPIVRPAAPAMMVSRSREATEAQVPRAPGVLDPAPRRSCFPVLLIIVVLQRSNHSGYINSLEPRPPAPVRSLLRDLL